MRLLRKGTANRHTGETRTNALSSRSHCVFTCIVESKTVEDGVTAVRTARLHLVDLAGAPCFEHMQGLLLYFTATVQACNKHMTGV